MPTNVTTRTSLEDAQSIIDSIHQQAEAERQAAEQNKQPQQLPESMSKPPFAATSALGGNVSSPLDMLPQPATQTTSTYYSRPEQDTAAIKELQEFYNYSDIRTRSTQSEYETAVNRLNEIGEQLEQMSPLLTQLQQYYETGPSDTTKYLYTAKVNEYNSLADEYRELDGKLPGLYNSYAIHHGLLTDSVNAIEKFSNDQQAELDAWRSTIRTDEDAISSELEQANAQLKALASTAKAWGDPEEEKETDRQAQELLQKIKLLEEELDWSRYYGYEGLRDAPDFAELSRYVSTATGEEPEADNVSGVYLNTGFADVDYDVINRNEDAKSVRSANDSAEYATLFGVDNRERGQMTDDEIAIFNYLYAQDTANGDTEHTTAYAYIDYLTDDLNYRQRREEEEYWREYANEHKAAASAFSVVISPAKAVTYVMQLADYLTDGEIDQNASYNWPSHINSAIRGQIAETIEKSGKWGKVGSLAYQTGMSMADFLYTGLITGSLAGGGAAASGLALTIMSMSAAADATIEAKDKGLSDRQAFVLGAVAGAAEALTEKFSIEALLSGKWEDSLIKYILKNAFTEGVEEVGSDLINTLADILVSQDQSEWLQAVNGYMTEGKTQGEAFGLAARDQALAMGLDLLGGAASGGIMAGVGGGIGSIKLASDYKKTGGALRSMGIETVTNITDIALTLDSNGKAHKLAQQVQTQLEKTGSVTDTQLGKLFAATASELRGDKNTARRGVAEGEPNAASPEGAALSDARMPAQQELETSARTAAADTGEAQVRTAETAADEIAAQPDPAAGVWDAAWDESINKDTAQPGTLAEAIASAQNDGAQMYTERTDAAAADAPAAPAPDAGVWDAAWDESINKNTARRGIAEGEPNAASPDGAALSDARMPAQQELETSARTAAADTGEAQIRTAETAADEIAAQLDPAAGEIAAQPGTLAESIASAQNDGAQKDAAAQNDPSSQDVVKDIETESALGRKSGDKAASDGAKLSKLAAAVRERAKNFSYGKEISASTHEAALDTVKRYMADEIGFSDAIEGYAVLYAEVVRTNKKWKWKRDVFGGKKIRREMKSQIKEQAISMGLLPDAKVQRLGRKRYASQGFRDVGASLCEMELPKELWKLSDKKQFAWLNEQIDGKIEGMVWHHTEEAGIMMLVPFGLHNITSHDGGRAPGEWCFGVR